jgi:hypothetical protein
MKKTLIILILGMFVLPINAQQTQKNLDYLQSAKKKIGIGATLTLVGVGTMVGGAIVYVNGLNGMENSTTDEALFSNLGTGLGGLAIFVVGEILFDVGLPFWIVGSVQKKRANRQLQLTMVNFKSPNNSTPINGIGFKISF